MRSLASNLSHQGLKVDLLCLSLMRLTEGLLHPGGDFGLVTSECFPRSADTVLLRFKTAVMYRGFPGSWESHFSTLSIVETGLDCHAKGHHSGQYEGFLVHRCETTARCFRRGGDSNQTGIDFTFPTQLRRSKVTD